MEKLAQELVNTNSVSMVSKIYDQYLDVIALEPALFTLNIKDSFMLYNEPSLSETQIRWGFFYYYNYEYEYDYDIIILL